MKLTMDTTVNADFTTALNRLVADLEKQHSGAARTVSSVTSNRRVARLAVGEVVREYELNSSGATSHNTLTVNAKEKTARLVSVDTGRGSDPIPTEVTLTAAGDATAVKVCVDAPESMAQVVVAQLMASRATLGSSRAARSHALEV